jgi:hypothetical protein
MQIRTHHQLSTVTKMPKDGETAVARDEHLASIAFRAC